MTDQIMSQVLSKQIRNEETTLKEQREYGDETFFKYSVDGANSEDEEHGEDEERKSAVDNEDERRGSSSGAEAGEEGEPEGDKVEQDGTSEEEEENASSNTGEEDEGSDRIHAEVQE